MSLNPWLPVPMTPMVVRSLAAGWLLVPSADAGTMSGVARAADCLRNCRREGRQAMGSPPTRGGARLASIEFASGGCKLVAFRSAKGRYRQSHRFLTLPCWRGGLAFLLV